MSLNSFSERYKTKTPSELLTILNNPDAYQPEALEAARLELDSRQLTNDQLDAARDEFRAKAIERDRKTKHQTTIADLSLTSSEFPSDVLDPIQTPTTSTTDKNIKLIAFYLGSLSAYHLYFKSGILVYIFTTDSKDFDVSFINYLIPVLVLPASAVLIFLKKRLGWILAVFFALSTASAAVEGVIFDLLSDPVEIMNVVIPSIPLTIYVISFVVEGGVAWPLCQPKIREVFRIDKSMMYSTIGVGVAYTLLMWFYFVWI